MQKIKASPQMSGFLSLRPGEESLSWVFYDIIDFPAATAIPTEVRFFARQKNGTTVTDEDTNLLVASQPVSEGQRFFATGFGLSVLPAAADTSPITDVGAGPTTADDRVSLMNRGYVTLQLLGQKTYVEGCPISLYPCGFGVAGSVAVANAAETHDAIVNNGLPNVGNVRKLALPIPSKTTVNVIVRYPKGAITPTNALRFGAFLEGVLYRAIQ